jgi:hypothetical protein
MAVHQLPLAVLAAKDLGDPQIELDGFPRYLGGRALEANPVGEVPAGTFLDDLQPVLAVRPERRGVAFVASPDLLRALKVAAAGPEERCR